MSPLGRATLVVLVVVIVLSLCYCTYQEQQAVLKEERGIEVETESGKRVNNARWQLVLSRPVSVAINPVKEPTAGKAVLIGSRTIGGDELALYIFLNEEGGKSILCNGKASFLEISGQSVASQPVILNKTLYSCFPVTMRMLNSRRVVVVP